MNLCAALSPGDPEALQKIAIAAAFHDLGIWTDRHLRLPAAVDPAGARAYLAGCGRAEWTPEVTAMILEHHKITTYRGEHGWSSPSGGRTGSTSPGAS